MKQTIIATGAALALVGLAFLMTGSEPEDTGVPASNIYGENGVQIVEVRARGGYAPARSVAKAGVPTTLRMTTAGTFDCSSSVRIPSMGIERSLPMSGATDIDLGSPGAGALQGICGMGMYSFEVKFE